MNKKALPLTVALALMAIAARAYAQSTTSTAGTDTSASQNEKAPAASADRMPGMKGKGGFGHGTSSSNTELLSLLGLDAAGLKKELQAGKSLSEIAAEKGVDKQKLIYSLLQKEEERIKTFIDQKHTAPAIGTSAGTSTSAAASQA
ncbi:MULTISPECIES: hypothetical protein [Paenibacillus]|uniref:hypothetical protein n=1 Tax=Paenibacillus TaxID=44249 RepID=UPI0022B8FB77|nr:hypothetical protein [Paenibacillus caseinilyticus]MCZ8523427.1 hypothetical protein [Paenibacillus caseinilyticus]